MVNRKKILRESHILSGGHIPDSDQAAFTLSLPKHLTIPLLIAVPHAGRAYPDALLQEMRAADRAKIRLEDRYVDILGENIARQTGAALLIAHAPRAMIDLNRACDDVDWTMVRGPKDGAKEGPKGPTDGVDGANRADGAVFSTNRRARNGLGLIPRRLSEMGEIWTGPISREQLDARIAQIHQPYHEALAQALEHIRADWGGALLLDLHSMPPLKGNIGGEKSANIVVGDRFGAAASDRLVALALQQLNATGLLASYNRPYAGGYVLDRHAAPERNIHAMQLEVCRSLYLEEDMATQNMAMQPLADKLVATVRSLGDEMALMARRKMAAIAAE